MICSFLISTSLLILCLRNNLFYMILMYDMLNFISGIRYMILSFSFSLLLVLCSFNYSREYTLQLPSYEVVLKDQSQNEYEGNVVIMVFNERKRELDEVNVSLYENSKKTAELEESTSMSVFQASENEFVIHVSRSGYVEVRTNPISITKGKFCEVRFYLQKK